MIGEYTVFDKQIANELIKQGFPLREIGGNKYNVYYFDDTMELVLAIEKIIKKDRQ